MSHDRIQFRASFWSTCTRNLFRIPIPESAKFRSESIQFDQKSSNLVHLFDQFIHEIYSWSRQKPDLKVFSWTHAKTVSWEPGRRNRVKCLTPRLWARTDRRTHGQTDRRTYYFWGSLHNGPFGQLWETSQNTCTFLLDRNSFWSTTHNSERKHLCKSVWHARNLSETAKNQLSK